MRTQLAIILSLSSACGGPTTDVTEPTAEPVTTATAEPTTAPTSAPTASPTSAPVDTTSEAGDEWKVESGKAKGVTLENDAGKMLTLATLGWTSFTRSTKPKSDAAIPNANVTFATVSGDDAVVSEVVCALPAWEEFSKDPATLATTLVPLVAKDAVPAAALAKLKPALLACGGGKQLRVEWEFKESALVGAKAVGGDAKASACVKTALAKGFMMDTGVCAATIAP